MLPVRVNKYLYSSNNHSFYDYSGFLRPLWPTVGPAPTATTQTAPSPAPAATGMSCGWRDLGAQTWTSVLSGAGSELKIDLMK